MSHMVGKTSIKKILTGTVMKERCVWPSSAFPRGGKNKTEDTEHVLQCNKGDPTLERQNNTNAGGPQ